jgi:hypothetical protein
MIDPFHIAVAIGPLAIYFLLVGYIRMQKKPLVTTGGRELAALAFALIGFAAIGPMELFFPRAAVMWLGSKVWLLMSILYALSIMLVILNSRPRIIVYGLDGEELGDYLREVFASLDPHALWLGNNVVSPALGIQAIAESAGPGQVSHLVATSRAQDFDSWLVVERELAALLRPIRISNRRAGQYFLLAGLILLCISAIALLKDPQATTQAMRLMLRR